MRSLLLDIWDVIPSHMVINGLYESDKDCLYNCRIKYRLGADGEKIPIEIMYCSRMIFNPLGVKIAEKTKAVEWRIAYDEANAELFGGAFPRSGNYKPEKRPEDNLARSKRRAIGKLNDYIMANDFDCFVTLTLDGEKIDREDYGAVMKKLNVYLDNRVRRQGLRYIGVPELHKKGGLHFHFLCNSEALKLVDSGTVSCKGRKKPIKVATADRLHIPQNERQTVYNVQDWELGFSTAIRTYGERGAVARYLGKYITKGTEKVGTKGTEKVGERKGTEKVGGRWYYSGGKLALPLCEYDKGGFDSFIGTYEYELSGTRFKVAKFDDKGVMISYGSTVENVQCDCEQS